MVTQESGVSAEDGLKKGWEERERWRRESDESR